MCKGPAPHTRIFWLGFTKMNLKNTHYFDFMFRTPNGNRRNQTIAINDAPEFPWDIIVLGHDFIRNTPLLYLPVLRQIRFNGSNDEELVCKSVDLHIALAQTCIPPQNKTLKIQSHDLIHLFTNP